MEQLTIDFAASVSQRTRRAVVAPAGEDPQLALFRPAHSFDIHLLSTAEAVADVGGPDPDAATAWLARQVGPLRAVRNRRYGFPAERLDRLLSPRPPVQVSLDATCLAVARGLWAAKLDLRPLRIRRKGNRLSATSGRSWPAGFGLRDIPWPAVAALDSLGVSFEVEPSAQRLLADRLQRSGVAVATGHLAGSAVELEARHPNLLERLPIPGLAYAGGPESGRYRLPLLAAKPLLAMPQIRLTKSCEDAIRKATGPLRPHKPRDGFPWNLYKFQAQDVAKALRIMQTCGGALIAGDPGTGKTTMGLAVADHLNLWPMLVVCPLSAFSTWERQLTEMGRRVYLATDSPQQSWERLAARDWDVAVVSYDRLPAFIELVDRLAADPTGAGAGEQPNLGAGKRRFDPARSQGAATIATGLRCLLIDEAQRIKGAGTKRSKAVRALAASVPYRIALSGTPMTNRLDDLLPIGSFVAPGEWKPRTSTRDLADLYPPDPVANITAHLATIMVRRRMLDTGAKLPDRNDHRVYVNLTPEQRTALEDLEAEAQAAKQAGEFDGNQGRMHAFARLHAMRQIVNAPSAAGVPGPNPKLTAAVDLVEEFLEEGRKGVVFVADRPAYTQLRDLLRAKGIGHVGIWGSTPVAERVEAEHRFHTDPDVKLVVATIQSASEAVTFSPTGTFLLLCALPYSPATWDQATARIRRMNQTEEVDIIEIVARPPDDKQGLDDRIIEILNTKRALISQVVDQIDWTDSTKVHLSMSDLTYLVTGTRDDTTTALEADQAAEAARHQARKTHARATAHGHKKANRDLAAARDDGTQTQTREQWAAAQAS